ncbi:unnamed protein product, partial [Bubo scandiacus]
LKIHQCRGAVEIHSIVMEYTSVLETKLKVRMQRDWKLVKGNLYPFCFLWGYICRMPGKIYAQRENQPGDGRCSEPKFGGRTGI